MATHVSNSEGMELLAEHIGVDLDILKKASEDKKESARIARLQAQLLAEKEDERRNLERARAQILKDWENGNIIVCIEGKLKAKPCDICKDGTPDETKLGHMITAIKRVRGPLLMNFKGGVSGSSEARRAASITFSIPCSCGRDHQVDVFITCNE